MTVEQNAEDLQKVLDKNIHLKEFLINIPNTDAFNDIMLSKIDPFLNETLNNFQKKLTKLKRNLTSSKKNFYFSFISIYVKIIFYFIKRSFSYKGDQTSLYCRVYAIYCYVSKRRFTL